jgi:hypothetical protein
MTRIANLPERGKTPNDPVSLSEIFRTKEYAAEIKAALKKGYTFENLAEIFTERCGITVSARQIKYHFTRAKNRSVKGKPGKKAGGGGTSGNHASPEDSPGKAITEGVKENLISPDSQVKASSNVSGFVFKNSATTNAEMNTNFSAFSLDMRPKES